MTASGSPLANRLRTLRRHHFPQALTQRQLSQALGLSGALISSWESGAAVPPELLLRSYALFFCSDRSVRGDVVRLLPDDELTTEEQLARETLFQELRGLRQFVPDETDGPEPAGRTGALGCRFLHFPDGQPVTVLCTPLTRRQLGYSEEAAQAGDLLPVVQYMTNQNHPNFIRNLANADVDALIELVGHVRAENPATEISWLTYDRISSADQLTGHLVLLGGVDEHLGAPPAGGSYVLEVLRSRIGSPVRMRWDDDGLEFDGEVQLLLDRDGVPTSDPQDAVQFEAFRPVWVRGSDDPRGRALYRATPQLTSDIAVVQRGPNPFNPGVGVTWFGGMFSRGTYGAVRAFTDPRFRLRNMQWLESNLDPEDFWMLLRVPVVAGTTLTPDLARASTRLRTS
ncbi:helix-turn-helix transcriptional regulator [Kineosporia sp. J2-2]|uniref:Helix-turn-helix transcriptional regulator n=1 Tax=Kineosporia corallincola TaxID=2835133 RepID=A0ABS5T9U9_9ACTN|nr:helix-turn-helix transcriptional regulator [Kineosporia corallincola]MBT0767822.1 helix-turn-helix transcriptional regulator [Kineosporia corallincola]